jgi:hypothetical protein
MLQLIQPTEAEILSLDNKAIWETVIVRVTADRTTKEHSSPPASGTVRNPHLLTDYKCRFLHQFQQITRSADSNGPFIVMGSDS